MCFSCIPKEAAAEIIGQFGGVQDLLSAMRAFPNSKAIASNCCGALWSLAVSGMARLRVVSKSLISGENDRAGGIHASSPCVADPPNLERATRVFHPLCYFAPQFENFFFMYEFNSFCF